MEIDLTKKLNLIQGDCLEVLKQLPDESIDLILTDPPYGYSFMGKDWDKAVPKVEIWKECLRVLKSGSFAFVMSAPRSDVQAEMIFKLKEAGFEVSFTPIYWAYASGFPKASNISKMVDKRLGVEREVIADNPNVRKNHKGHVLELGLKQEGISLATSEEAIKLDGLFGGFQPKPAVEVVLVVMKPCSEKTFVEQALKNGHGGTWLGKCRIPYANGVDEMGDWNRFKGFQSVDTIRKNMVDEKQEFDERVDNGINVDGRFPANLLVSDNVLDNGIPTNKGHWSKTKTTGFGEFGNGKSEYFGVGEKNQAEGFSRYFSLDAWWEKAVKELPEEQQKTFPFLIVPKASKSEKNKGCEHLQEQIYCDRNPELDSADVPINRSSNAKKNFHPTVKPLKLMQYLTTLGSNINEIVLDPFMGSGTTCIATNLQGRKIIGIEMNKEYFEIAKKRCSYWENQPRLI